MPADPVLGPERDLRLLRTTYRALGDETRLRMIGLLAQVGPMPVSELSARVMLSQPLISWHLRILRLARLIDTQRQGRTVICRLRLAAFEELHESEERLISGAAGIGGEQDAGAAGSTPRPSAEGKVVDVR
jgi:ArsR family transcriptional regulator